MIPKTFVFEDKNNRSVYVPAAPRARRGAVRCSCTYVCEQFMAYPIDVHGRRIIPVNTPCPCGGFCDGRQVIENGMFRPATGAELRWLVKIYEKER